MIKIPVFYSFHYHNDVMRVQLVRNMGFIEGNSPTSANEWERLKRSGDNAVKSWIDTNMKYKRCVVVLIGTETSDRPWVQYEIEKAWNDGKALLGIHIHNLRCPRTGICRKGKNPFDMFTLQNGTRLSSLIPCYDPNPSFAYREISSNIGRWVNSAITNKRN
ncbi:MAG: TIR domain-containing protein [Methylotenera sp.]